MAGGSNPSAATILKIIFYIQLVIENMVAPFQLSYTERTYNKDHIQGFNNGSSGIFGVI